MCGDDFFKRNLLSQSSHPDDCVVNISGLPGHSRSRAAPEEPNPREPTSGRDFPGRSRTDGTGGIGPL
jgi:hypothetical protein